MPLPSSSSILHTAKHITCARNERNFQSHFGLPSLCVEQLWRFICHHYPQLPRGWGLEELFLTLFFLKSPGRNLETTASQFHIHSQTMMKWIDITLTMICSVLPEVFRLKLYFILFYFPAWFEWLLGKMALYCAFSNYWYIYCWCDSASSAILAVSLWVKSIRN